MGTEIVHNLVLLDNHKDNVSHNSNKHWQQHRQQSHHRQHRQSNTTDNIILLLCAILCRRLCKFVGGVWDWALRSHGHSSPVMCTNGGLRNHSLSSIRYFSPIMLFKVCTISLQVRLRTLYNLMYIVTRIHCVKSNTCGKNNAYRVLCHTYMYNVMHIP